MLEFLGSPLTTILFGSLFILTMAVLFYLILKGEKRIRESEKDDYSK
jgi:hypothetical protein